MFTNLTIGILAGLGFATWVYTKVMRSTGGNTQNSVIVAVIAGAATVLLAVSLLSFIPGN